ncbi:hypothetical protein CL684_00210 [Candidatus Campbellbacteria bacterium]|nr:hypothetical protein [Candidatus Campbellbacteria bacterium]|tara:strand:- start:1844 stop:2755 length:912 start_codon:yes stop_codon:yes gene_type:complete
MNFNPDFIKIETNTTRLTENLSKQNRLLEKIKNQKELYAPKEEDFVDVHGEAVVQKDKALVEKIKQKHLEKNDNDENQELLEKLKRISDIYEGVIGEQAEQNEWFGSGVNFYPTSEYDDFVNGVDGVAEFFDEAEESDAHHIAMSFDVVFSNHSERVISKLDRTKEMIDKGELAEVKYFEDQNGNKRKILASRIILGSRLVSAENLINLWASKSPERNKKLANHPIQIKLLLETLLQSQHFYNYASSLGKNEIAYSYGVIANKISDILNEEKSDLLSEYFHEVKEDIVFESIKDYCVLAPSLE